MLPRYETEAGRYGLDFLQRAGISPEYYATILRKVQKAKVGTCGSSSGRLVQNEGARTLFDIP